MHKQPKRLGPSNADYDAITPRSTERCPTPSHGAFFNSLGRFREVIVASLVGQEHNRLMLYLVVKALISGIIIAAVSEIAKRSPGLGALVASLPLVSVLGMVWL